MLPDVLVPLRTGGDGPPLYCVHAVSGSCYTYLPLAAALGDRPVIGIEAPGYDGDGRPPQSLAEMADLYTRVLEADHPDGPISLLGWSGGGVVALETARRLRARGRRVPVVTMVDTRVPAAEPALSERAVRARFVADFASGAFADVAARMAEVLRIGTAGSSDDQNWDQLRYRGWLPAEMDSATLERRFQVFRTNVEALNRHRVERGADHPVLVVRAQQAPPETSRWSDMIPGAREVTVQGDHYSLWRGGGPAEIARLVVAAAPAKNAVAGNGTRP